MMRRTATTLRAQVGISAMSLYVPPFRVNLEEWCQWTGNSWPKVRNIVGTSFRVPGKHENVYTMAANAGLQMMLEHAIDPESIGFIGFGTESSTDNSAGAVILKGMLDRALEQKGHGRITRHVEVPEFKHACLGGVYALKNACRFVELDERGRKALVLCGDIAEYERGTSGEQTQGAGAVAMLVERNPLIAAVHHGKAGSSSSYRGPDFRKPVSRHFSDNWAKNTQRHSDFPVFSGPYSTTVYTDTTIYAVEDMLRQMSAGSTSQGGGRYFEALRALFLHRPYKAMPVQAVSYMYVRGLARGLHRQDKLHELCQAANVDPEALKAEIGSDDATDPYSVICASGKPPVLHKLQGEVAKVLRKDPEFISMLEEKMAFGQDLTAQLGNLYSAALPAWMAAGLEDAARKEVELGGCAAVGIGYGSGDASEAIPMTIMPGYEAAAKKSGVAAALAKAPVDLTKEQYEAIHDTRHADAFPSYTPKEEFFIDRVGSRVEPAFQDLGIEYYEYAQ